MLTRASDLLLPSPDAPQVPRSEPNPKNVVDVSVRGPGLFEAPYVDKLRALKPFDLEVQRLTRAEVAAIEADWQDLAENALEPNPFYEPWMALPALELEPERNVEFIALWAMHPSGRKGERLLCGLFPLAEQVAKGPLPVRMLSLWMHPYCYLCTPLVRGPTARATLGAFFDWVEKGGAGRGLFRFEDVPGDGVFRQLFVEELWNRKWPSFLGDAFTRAFFRPAADAETFLRNAVPSKRRKEYKRQGARLGELGAVRFDELQHPDDVARWADEFAQLEVAGWKGRQNVAVAVRQEHLRFFRTLVRQAALRDRLMLLALRVDGKPIAMKLNLLGGGGGFAFKITYDEHYAKYSPGVLLELENIQQLHARTDVQWMDSCASPNRFMINHLWPERREFQSVLFGPDAAMPTLAMALLPLRRWMRRRVAELRNRLQPSSSTSSQQRSEASHAE